jgi:hypothetical protein
LARRDPDIGAARIGRARLNAPSGARAAGSALTPALALLMASTLGLGALQYGPAGDAAPVLAFFPFRSDAEAVRTAMSVPDARLVGRGRLPGSLVLQSMQPGLPARLRDAGAWLVLDGKGRAGCLVSPTKSMRGNADGK